MTAVDGSGDHRYEDDEPTLFPDEGNGLDETLREAQVWLLDKRDGTFTRWGLAITRARSLLRGERRTG